MANISIIVPVYNTEKYIANSMQSLVNQSYKNFEVILVNDETKDNAIQIAEKILITNKIEYHILNQKNQGQGFSRNNGVAISNAKWIIFLDSDDILQNDALELMVNAGEKNNADFVFSSFQYVKPGDEFKTVENNREVVLFSKKEIQEGFLTRKEIVLVPGTLYNKDWYDNTNLKFKNIPYSEDQLFMWEILRKCNRVCKVEKKMYNYLVRDNSIMTGSKFEKIIIGYPYFEEIQDKYRADGEMFVSRFLLSRWVFGIMRSASKLCDENEYKELIKKFDAKTHYKNLSFFPDKKVMAFSLLCYLFPSLIYRLNKLI